MLIVENENKFKNSNFQAHYEIFFQTVTEGIIGTLM